MARRPYITPLLITLLLAHHTLAASIDLTLTPPDSDGYPYANITYSPAASAKPSLLSNPAWNASPGFHGTSSANNPHASWTNGTFNLLDHVPKSYTKVRVAHAVLASVAWLILFPLGGIIPRIRQELVFPLHAGLQMFAYAIFAVAAGMGIWMARHIQQLGRYHPVIGMILLGLLAVQPLTESLNAIFYNPAHHKKIIILGHIHIWLGRALLTAGIINGGLGSLFSGSFPWNSRSLAPRIAYGVVANIVWITYICVAVVWPYLKRNGFRLEDLKPRFGKRKLSDKGEVHIGSEELGELRRGSVTPRAGSVV